MLRVNGSVLELSEYDEYGDPPPPQKKKKSSLPSTSTFSSLILDGRHQGIEHFFWEKT